MTRLAAAAALTLAVAACGGGGEDGVDVASLGGDATTTTDGGGGGGRGRAIDDSAFQDAMLEYAECMRDEGIDFPDPEFDGEGGVAIIGRGAADGPPSEAEQEEMETADEVCNPILEDARSEMPRPSPEEQQEMEDQALEFAECMRDHGIDFPDPQFDEDGGVQIGIGGGEDGEGTRGPGGLDPEDPEFQEAREACQGEDGIFGPPRVGTSTSEDE